MFLIFQTQPTKSLQKTDEFHSSRSKM